MRTRCGEGKERSRKDGEGGDRGRKWACRAREAGRTSWNRGVCLSVCALVADTAWKFDKRACLCAEQWNTASNSRHCNKHFAILVGEHSSLNSFEDTKRVKRGRGAAKGTGRNGKVCTVEKEEWRCGQQATMQCLHSEDEQVHTLVCCSPQPRWGQPLDRSRAGSRPRKRPAVRERAGVPRQTGVRWVM